VPFAGRKLAGFVLARSDRAPEGVTRLKNVAGLLDPEPIFPRELLEFLLAAADYYLHPIGEVLRAAAPAMRTDALAALRGEGFLDPKETLGGATVAMRRALFVAATGEAVRGRLGARQRAILALTEERGEVSVDELRARAPTPLAVLRGLEK